MLRRWVFIQNASDEPQVLKHPLFRTTQFVSMLPEGIVKAQYGRLTIPPGSVVHAPVSVWSMSARKLAWAKELTEEEALEQAEIVRAARLEVETGAVNDPDPPEDFEPENGEEIVPAAEEGEPETVEPDVAPVPVEDAPTETVEPDVAPVPVEDAPTETVEHVPDPEPVEETTAMPAPEPVKKSRKK